MKTHTYLYLKNAFFFHFLFTFSRAFLRAIARAYNITFFLRARAHAREKVTRIAIIDRPLSMIVGGRVGALFFIVCFLSVYRYKSSVFVSLLPHGRLNEWKEPGKNGQRGFEYGEFWLARASFSLFCVLFFVVVLLHIFSLLHRRRSQRRHMEERAFFGKEFQPFLFLESSLEHPFAMLSLS